LLFLGILGLLLRLVGVIGPLLVEKLVLKRDVLVEAIEPGVLGILQGLAELLALALAGLEEVVHQDVGLGVLLFELVKQLLPVLDAAQIEAGQVLLGDDGIDQEPARRRGLVVGQVLGLEGVQPKAGGDEQEDAGPEQEAAFPLQAGLAQQTLE